MGSLPREGFWSSAAVKDGFDVMPVRVEDERSVIVRVVVRSDAGLAKSFPPASSAATWKASTSARLCAAKAMWVGVMTWSCSGF